jgi:hypothetical protein
MELVQPHRSFSIFGDDGDIESLASTQGPSKVATQIKSIRENRKFCSKLQWMLQIKTVLGDSVKACASGKAKAST